MATFTLIERTDEELDTIEASQNSQGKPPTYPPVILQWVAEANGRQVSGVLNWKDANPEATPGKTKNGKPGKSERDVVLAGLRTAFNTSPKLENARKAVTVNFLRAPDSDDGITVVIRQNKPATTEAKDK